MQAEAHEAKLDATLETAQEKIRDIPEELKLEITPVIALQNHRYDAEVT